MLLSGVLELEKHVLPSFNHVRIGEPAFKNKSILIQGAPQKAWVSFSNQSGVSPSWQIAQFLFFTIDQLREAEIKIVFAEFLLPTSAQKWAEGIQVCNSVYRRFFHLF